MVQGKYQVKPPLPFTPGSEVAGKVLKVGKNVNHINVGDKCVASLMLGGFSEHVLINSDNVVKLPNHVDLTHAAGFM